MISMYVFTTNDPKGWEHAIRDNNCKVVAVVTGEQEAVEAFIEDNYDDEFGMTPLGEDMPQYESCEYIEI